MRIGVLNPNWGFISGSHTMHKWAEVFINKYCDTELNFTQSKNYGGDVIIQLSGRPDLEENYPPKEFKGLKLCHLYDHVFQSEKANKNLTQNGVHYVLCYSSLDQYDSFFRKAYPSYIGKVIPVPFGYHNNRFSNIKDFGKRKCKVVALGAVNPVKDPLCMEDIKGFYEHYSTESYTHRWRKKLYDNKENLEKHMDSFFPEFPKTKDFDYDIVQTYNDYQMFTTCESIMGYPSVKVYEGMACGSVFIGNRHPCYEEIGLIDGVNCLLHASENLDSFKMMVEIAQKSPGVLRDISFRGQAFVEENYTPEKIADNLFSKIKYLT